MRATAAARAARKSWKARAGVVAARDDSAKAVESFEAQLAVVVSAGKKAQRQVSSLTVPWDGARGRSAFEANLLLLLFS